MTGADCRAFVVIGENVHATRTYRRQGRNMGTLNGVEHLRFVAGDGEERTCPIAEPVAQSTEFARNRVKHIRNGLLLGLGADGLLPPSKTGPVTPEAGQAGRDYLIAAAIRQQVAGASYIDVNVDEIDDDEGICVLAIEWLVHLLEPELSVPLSLDSSSVATLHAGLRSSAAPRGPLLINSACAERPEALDLAAQSGSAIVLSAAGIGALPATVEGRVKNANDIYAAALERGIKPADCHVDMLVLPVGVDGPSGATFLGSVRAFRARHGPDVRITGGLSNVSYGLPNRRLLNDAFVALSIDAGVDSGILDPIAVGLTRVRNLDRGALPFRIAVDVLAGVDPFASRYLMAHRAGELVGA